MLTFAPARTRNQKHIWISLHGKLYLPICFFSLRLFSLKICQGESWKTQKRQKKGHPASVQQQDEILVSVLCGFISKKQPSKRTTIKVLSLLSADRRHLLILVWDYDKNIWRQSKIWTCMRLNSGQQHVISKYVLVDGEDGEIPASDPSLVPLFGTQVSL